MDNYVVGISNIFVIYYHMAHPVPELNEWCLHNGCPYYLPLHKKL